MKIFLDDFIVFGDLSTHLEKFKKCFLKCKEYGINLNLNKCAFMVFWNYFGIYSLQRRENI
jgi:hypothetical protein